MTCHRIQARSATDSTHVLDKPLLEVFAVGKTLPSMRIHPLVATARLVLCPCDGTQHDCCPDADVMQTANCCCVGSKPHKMCGAQAQPEDPPCVDQAGQMKSYKGTDLQFSFLAPFTRLAYGLAIAKSGRALHGNAS